MVEQLLKMEAREDMSAESIAAMMSPRELRGITFMTIQGKAPS